MPGRLSEKWKKFAGFQCSVFMKRKNAAEIENWRLEDSGEEKVEGFGMRGDGGWLEIGWTGDGPLGGRGVLVSSACRFIETEAPWGIFD